MMPEGRPSYRLWDRIRWPFPPDKADELARVVEAAFRSAPAERVSGALYRLRVLTRGRFPVSAEDREAEGVIFLGKLQTYPGDVVLNVLDTWHRRPSGSFWPDWKELEQALDVVVSKRRTIALCILKQAREEPRRLGVMPQPAEQRERAADDAVQRFRLSAREVARQALERNMSKALVLDEAGQLAAFVNANQDLYEQATDVEVEAEGMGWPFLASKFQEARMGQTSA